MSLYLVNIQPSLKSHPPHQNFLDLPLVVDRGSWAINSIQVNNLFACVQLRQRLRTHTWSLSKRSEKDGIDIVTFKLTGQRKTMSWSSRQAALVACFNEHAFLKETKEKKKSKSNTNMHQTAGTASLFHYSISLLDIMLHSHRSYQNPKLWY